MKRQRSIAAIFLALLLATAVQPRPQTQQPQPGLLNLDTIFTYAPETLDAIQWQPDGSGYLVLEPSEGAKGKLDLARYDAATGKRAILVAAEKLAGPGAAEPLLIEDYAFSNDGQRVLIFTNSARVWRSNTRGDYWVFDLKNSKLQKLGGDAKPSTLMFAKFSPDGTRVGYVRENNIYVQDLADGHIKQLTTD